MFFSPRSSWMPIRGRGRWPRTPVDECAPGGVITRYVVMRRPHHEKALALLKEVGHAVQTLMRMHGWTVHVLAEMYPRNAQLLGLNYNRGEKICLRLRESSDESAFLTRDAILATYVCFSHTSMLHELAYVCCTDPATTCVDPMTMCSIIHYRHSLTNIPRRSAWGTGQAPAFSHPARVSAAAACLQMHGSGGSLQLRRQCADRARQAVAHAWEEQRRHDP